MSPFRPAVAIPTYSRPKFLQDLISTVPTGIPVYVSDNAGSLKDQNLEFGPHVIVSPASTLVPIFSNWNRALSLVGQDITHVLIPSDDDLYLPGAFQQITAAAARTPDADVFIFGCDLVDESGNVRKGYVPGRSETLDRGQGLLRQLYGVDTRMPGVMFRKEFLDRIGAFDERFALTAADSELIQRALLLGKAVFVPDVVGLYRVWAGGLTHSRQASSEWMDEIEIWTAKINRILGSDDRYRALNISGNRYRDEIFARNLLAGVRGLMRRNEHGAARQFLRDQRMPSAASLRTRLKLAYCRVRLSGRSRP